MEGSARRNATNPSRIVAMIPNEIFFRRVHISHFKDTPPRSAAHQRLGRLMVKENAKQNGGVARPVSSSLNARVHKRSTKWMSEFERAVASLNEFSAGSRT